VKLSIEQVDLGGRRVFLRADLNAPLEHGAVADDTRLTAVLPTIRHALDHGAAVVLASHLGRPKGRPDPTYSLAPVATRLEALLERPVPLAPDCVGEEVDALARALKPGQLLLLENLRFHPEEEANDDAFARRLAALAEVYVNDAFAAATAPTPRSPPSPVTCSRPWPACSCSASSRPWGGSSRPRHAR